MTERFFRHHIFKGDEDVVFVGLDAWHARPDGNRTPLLGNYLCNAKEVNERFDELEADLKRCRQETLAALGQMARSR